jgi:hypothetical protein
LLLVLALATVAFLLTLSRAVSLAVPRVVFPDLPTAAFPVVPLERVVSRVVLLDLALPTAASLAALLALPTVASRVVLRARAVFPVVLRAVLLDLPTAAFPVVLPARVVFLDLDLPLALLTAALLDPPTVVSLAAPLAPLALPPVPALTPTWPASSMASSPLRARVLLRLLSRVLPTVLSLDRASSTSSPSSPTLTRMSFTTQ